MYWWNIEKLKLELAAGPLRPSLAYTYGAIYVVCAAPLGFMPHGAYNGWDTISMLVAATIAFAGIRACYLANGGPNGRDFLDRFFSLSFVVTVRLLPALAIAVVLLGLLKGEKEEATVVDAITSLLGGLIYWRTAVHTRSVAGRAAEKP